MSSALNKASSASASAESKAPVLVADQEITNVKTKIDAIEAKIEALEAQLKKAEKKRDDWEEKDINSQQYKDAKEEVLSLRARINKEEDQLLALRQELHDLRRKEELLLQLPTSSSATSQGKPLLAYYRSFAFSAFLPCFIFADLYSEC